MSEPLVFAAASSRYGLPLLFAGQAQKEFFLNEALCRADALLHPAIEEERNDPPTAPANGQSWLIGATPTGIWADKAGLLACYQPGGWLYITPADGLQVLDRSTGQRMAYFGFWRRPLAPIAPAGGAVADTQIRASFAALIDALVEAGILRPS